MSIEIYEKNLAALIKRYPLLAEKADQAQLKKDYEYCFSKNGLHNICLNQAGRHLFYHSTYDPQKDASNLVNHYYSHNKAEVEKASFAVVLGVGFAYHVPVLLERLPWIKSFLLIEPSIDVFRTVISKMDLTDIISNPRIELVVGELTLSSLYGNQATSAYVYAPLIVVVLPQVENIFPGLKERSVKVLSSYLESLSAEINTSKYNGQEKVSNFFKNIPSFYKYQPVNNLFGRFKGMPIVCIASGPSLSDYLYDLKKMRKGAIFICADSAFKVLVENDIVPDVVVAMDPLHYKFEYFKENSKFTKNVLLVAGTSVYSELLDSWEGPINMAVSGSSTDKTYFFDNLAFPSVEKLPEVQTVALASLSIAKRFGGNPIVMVGQDLSFSDKTHASGADLCTDVKLIEGRNKAVLASTRFHEDVSAEVIYVDNYKGQNVLSTPTFKLYISRFEQYIAGIDANVYNLTRNGARINGAKRCDYGDIIDIFGKSVDFRAIYESVDQSHMADLSKGKVAVDGALLGCQEMNAWLTSVFKHVRKFSNESYQDRVEYISTRIKGIYENNNIFMNLLNQFDIKGLIRHNLSSYLYQSGKEVRYKLLYIDYLRFLFSIKKANILFEEALVMLKENLNILD